MATDKRPTMLRLQESTYEKLRFLAYSEHRSINKEIEHAIEIYIDNYEQQHGPIKIATEPD